MVIERQPPIITVFSPFLAFPFLSLLNRVIHVSRESRENCRAWCYRDYYSIDRFVGESRSEDLEQERERERGRCLIKTLDHENYGTYRIREAKSDGRQCDQELPSFNFDRSLLSPFLSSFSSDFVALLLELSLFLSAIVLVRRTTRRAPTLINVHGN